MLKYYNIFLFLILLNIGIASSMKTGNSESAKEFRYCLQKSEHPNLQECVGRTAISFLQRFEERDNFTLADNIIVARDETAAARSLVNFLDTNPVDFRGILENAGAVFSQRSLEFHMDAIYPGLMFKIGPSADSNSVAQFILDPSVTERNLNYEQPSTARILTRHYVLPFLLGLKFNLVALVPILFTIICLLLKKSLFITKLVIYISSLLGAGGIVGALGKFGGFNNIFSGHSLNDGFNGLPLPQPGLHIGGVAGAYPGKNTVYSQYDQDELQHVSPYKRLDRKVVFEKPRENIGHINKIRNNNLRATVEVPTLATHSSDRFYEYEKQVLMPDRAGKSRDLSGSLGAGTYYDDNKAEDTTSNRFQTSDNSGWTVLNIQN